MEVVILNQNPSNYFRKIWEKASKTYGFSVSFKESFKIENSNENEFLILSDKWVCCGGKFEKTINDIVLFKTSRGIETDIVYIQKNELTSDIFKDINQITFKKIIENLSQKNLPFISYDKKSCEIFKYTGPNKIFLSNIEDIQTELREYLIKTIFNSVFNKDNIYSVAHGGDLGDIIYSIAGLKELGTKKIILNPGGFYKTKMTSKTAALLKPFLEEQGFYVEIKEKISIDDGDIFLDFFREGVRNMEKNHLSITNFEKIFIEPNISKLKLETKPLSIADIVVSRTQRYRNPIFDYRYLLEELPSDIKICFVGLKEEYETFTKIYGMREKVFYYPTSDFLHLASVIKGAKIFIGNQSSPYALAEVLKLPRIQETCHLTPNCKGSTENSIDVLSNEDLYSAKIFLYKTLGLDIERKPPKTKTLLFTTSHINEQQDLEFLIRWINWHIQLNEKNNFFTNMLILDNSSDERFLIALKQIYPLSHIERIEFQDGIYVIPYILKERNLTVLSFKEKINTNSQHIVADFWRGYLFGISVADSLEYDKAVYLSSSAYILSDKMIYWTKNKNEFSCVYNNQKKPLISLQIIPKKNFLYFINLFSTNGKINEDFLYGHGMSKYSYLPDYFLRFENIPDEFKDFVIRKYKSNSKDVIPSDIDFLDIEKEYFIEKNQIKFQEINKIMEGSYECSSL